MSINIQLTVFFENPFWVGVFERVDEGSYEISRIVFGGEPTDSEVFQFILNDFNNITFGKEHCINIEGTKRINPKRLQRKVKKEIAKIGINTKAHLAIKEQQEIYKVEKKQKSKELKEAEKAKKFQLKQQKRREKHKGH